MGPTAPSEFQALNPEQCPPNPLAHLEEWNVGGDKIRLRDRGQSEKKDSGETPDPLKTMG